MGQSLASPLGTLVRIDPLEPAGGGAAYGIPGSNPPTTPPTAEEYTRSGLPWFKYYSDQPTLDARGLLKKLKSVIQIGAKKGDVPLPENASVDPANIVTLRKGLREGQVREGQF